MLCFYQMRWHENIDITVLFFSSPDIDNNGFLDKNDFECLALRTTLIEGRGEFKQDAYTNNQKIMSNLWNEIAELADFNKVRIKGKRRTVKEMETWKTSSSPNR